MEKITDIEIIEEIKNGCNVLIKAMTPWHANSIEAAYMGLELDIKPEIVVLCAYISPASRKIDENNFPYLKSLGARFYEYDITRFIGIKSKVGYMCRQMKQLFRRVKSEKKLYVFSQIVADAYLNTLILENIKDICIHNVIADEGVETYVPTNKYDSGLKRIISSMYEKKFPTKVDTLFLRNKKITLNKSIVKRYCDVYANCSEQVDEHDIEEIADAILVCFAPIKEEQSVNNAKELLRSIVECAHNEGMKVVVKMHPRETEIAFFSTIGCYVLKSTEVSMEALIEIAPIKPRMVVGIITTGLVTANVFWNIRTVSFLNCMYKTTSSQMSRNFSKRFIDAFEEYVEFINDFEEFSEMLKQ